MGIDFDEERLAIGKSLGAEIISIKEHPNPYPSVMSLQKKRIRLCLITASTKVTNQFRNKKMCRKRGGYSFRSYWSEPLKEFVL